MASLRDPGVSGSTMPGGDFTSGSSLTPSPMVVSRHVNVGALNGPDFEKLTERARAMGVGTNEAARALLLRALNSPVPEQEIEASQRKAPHIDCVSRIIKLGRHEEERTYLRLHLTPEQSKCALTWQTLLGCLTDHYHIAVLGEIYGKIPLCVYSEYRDTIERVLGSSGIVRKGDKPERIKEHQLPVLSDEERALNTKSPPVFLLEPARVLEFIESSRSLLDSVSEQVREAKRRYGSLFVGVETPADPTVGTLSVQQLELVNRLQKLCERLAPKPKS